MSLTSSMFHKLYVIGFLCALLASCGGGGDTSTTNTAESNNWDQMEWDNGSWEN